MQENLTQGLSKFVLDDKQKIVERNIILFLELFKAEMLIKIVQITAFRVLIYNTRFFNFFIIKKQFNRTLLISFH